MGYTCCLMHPGPCYPNDPLEGRRVVVVLDEGPPPMTVTGCMVSRTCDGEVVIDTDDGKRHGCWPMLRMSLDPDPCPKRGAP